MGALLFDTYVASRFKDFLFSVFSCSVPKTWYIVVWWGIVSFFRKFQSDNTIVYSSM